MSGTTNTIVNSNYANHPFKEGVALMLDQHFAPSIAERFYCVLEVEKYNKKDAGLNKQIKDNVFVMEVYYNQPNGMSVYICDLLSRWPKAYTEKHLLKHITDKFKSDQIGDNWVEKDGKISEVILTGKLQTFVDKHGDPIN